MNTIEILKKYVDGKYYLGYDAPDLFSLFNVSRNISIEDGNKFISKIPRMFHPDLVESIPIEYQYPYLLISENVTSKINGISKNRRFEEMKMAIDKNIKIISNMSSFKRNAAIDEFNRQNEEYIKNKKRTELVKPIYEYISRLNIDDCDDFYKLFGLDKNISYEEIVEAGLVEKLEDIKHAGINYPEFTKLSSGLQKSEEDFNKLKNALDKSYEKVSSKDNYLGIKPYEFGNDEVIDDEPIEEQESYNSYNPAFDLSYTPEIYMIKFNHIDLKEKIYQEMNDKYIKYLFGLISEYGVSLAYNTISNSYVPFELRLKYGKYGKDIHSSMINYVLSLSNAILESATCETYRKYGFVQAEKAITEFVLCDNPNFFTRGVSGSIGRNMVKDCLNGNIVSSVICVRSGYKDFLVLPNPLKYNYNGKEMIETFVNESYSSAYSNNTRKVYKRNK